MTREEVRQQLEAICVASWFLFDGFWLMQWRTATYLGSLVSVITALLVFCYLEKNLFQWLVAFVDTFWLFTNTLWFISEFQEWPALETAAKVCFLVGSVFLVAAYSVSPSTIVLLRRVGLFKFLFKQTDSENAV